MTIVTTNSYFSSTVDDSRLGEIKEALHRDNELIVYSRDELEGTITVIVDLSDIGENKLQYIH